MARDLFLSYTRVDKDHLPRLLRGLEKLHHRVWMDQQLDGGQQWWDTVLEKVRGADAVVLVLTPHVLESVASRREVEYAKEVGKPILPVMLERVTTDLLWPSIASVQIVDFTSENDQAIFDLVGALDRLPDALSLPDPLPDSPPVPVSYLTGLGEQLQKPTLTQDEQFLLLPKFKEGLQRPREREAVLQLMQRLRSREDLLAGPAKELDDLFDEVRREQQQTPSPPTPTPARPTAPQPAPKNGSGSGTKILVGILVGLVGAGAAFVLLIVTLGSTDSTENVSNNSPETTTSDSSPAETPAVGDACLVGDWVSTNTSGTVEVQSTSLQVSGGTGSQLRITSEGRMTSDLSSSDPLTYTDSNGNVRIERQLDGTITSDLRVSSDDSVEETLVSNDATIIDTVDGVEGNPERAVVSASTSYSCSSSTLKFSDRFGATIYERG